MGVTEFVSEIKNWCVIQNGLLGFILKNIKCQEPSESVSMEAGDL